MNRILILDKPPGMTSYDCIRQLKPFIDKNVKIGHAGTLDPLATGVLPILLGKATKLFDLFSGSRKAYIGEMQLGLSTDTADITGKVTGEQEPGVYTPDDIKEAFDVFVGGYLQTPPLFSAKHKDGKRFYDIARDEDTSLSENILPEPEFVDLYEYQIFDYDEKTHKILFSIDVGRGFYVRSFVEDVARHLGDIATLLSLRRVRAGYFSLDKAINIDSIEARGDIERLSISLEEATDMLPTVIVNDDMARKVSHGGKLKTDIFNEISGFVRIVNKNNRVLAIGISEMGHFKYNVVLGDDE